MLIMSEMKKKSNKKNKGEMFDDFIFEMLTNNLSCSDKMKKSLLSLDDASKLPLDQQLMMSHAKQR